MWITEVVPSWATSVFIMVILLLFTSDSGFKPMVNEEQVGTLLSYKDIMASFADPVIMLFIGGFILSMFPFSQKTIHLEIESNLEKTIQTKIVIWTFIGTVLLWLTDSLTGINANTVALIPFAVFAMTGVINWHDLEEINWSVIWMVAGGFALGYSLNASGLAENAVKSVPFSTSPPS